LFCVVNGIYVGIEVIEKFIYPYRQSYLRRVKKILPHKGSVNVWVFCFVFCAESFTVLSHIRVRRLIISTEEFVSYF
jgi:hypothetical protein